MILSAGTYSIEQFNQNMQEAIKGKGDQWVAAQIKDYKLIIPENHSLLSLKPFFDALEIKPQGLGISNGEYQTSLKPPPKKITLHCEEIDKFHNEIDSQPSTQLFSIDVKDDDEVHYTPSPIYLPLSSSSPLHSLHFTLLDETPSRGSTQDV